MGSELSSPGPRTIQGTPCDMYPNLNLTCPDEELKYEKMTIKSSILSIEHIYLIIQCSAYNMHIRYVFSSLNHLQLNMGKYNPTLTTSFEVQIQK